MLRGREFLTPLSGLPGAHPMGEAQEWDYVREVRGCEVSPWDFTQATAKVEDE